MGNFFSNLIGRSRKNDGLRIVVNGPMDGGSFSYVVVFSIDPSLVSQVFGLFAEQGLSTDPLMLSPYAVAFWWNTEQYPTLRSVLEPAFHSVHIKFIGDYNEE